jgi:outer membrane protein OmpA-like peptidoglycan-associated protein
MNIKVFFSAIVLFGIVGSGTAQVSKKTLSEAERFFGIRSYDQALPLFAEAVQAGEKDPIIHYKLGVCYQKTNDTNEQIKAIPYFEYALEKGAPGIPNTLLYDLGYLYLRDENLQKAIDSFNKYREANKADKAIVAKVDQALNECNTAVALMSVPRGITVQNFGSIINSKFTEYNPVVSADESVMAFTALRPNTGKTRSGDKYIEEVYISYNDQGSWTEAKVVPIASEYNVGTAGISPDGQKMLIFMGSTTDPGSLFQISKSGDSWGKPGLIAPTINTPKFLESTASITPDGKTIYFASDKAGGQGGLDIYKTTLQSNGTWTSPVNLGPPINTKANEDAPFIHPDQKTLFFTSEGHSSMGGHDIFMTKLVKDKEWTTPENMGYPVNTTANDNYFTLIADGTRAYFSSDRKGGMGGQDIYYLNMPEESANIPLTMIKGKILNAETGKPLPTKIYLIDNQTNKKLDFVYDPDPQTGNYLVILPPAKNYDMVIESEGFLPYTLNINVPNQDYFYELYQMISLKTIKQFDVVVGQEVLVKNAFYDTQQEVKADLRKTHEAKLVKEGNVDVYDMMLDLMAAKDEAGIEYLVGLISHKDPVDAVNFDDATNKNIEVATRTYYYDESDESKFEQKNVGGKVIFSLPTMQVAEEARKQKEIQNKVTNVDRGLLNKNAKIYFDAGKSDLKPEFNAELDKLLEILNKYNDLGVEISGFASAEGSEELNRDLSNKRAISVLDYLNHRGVVRRRIVAKGFGASKDDTATKEEGRRVELRIVDLNALTAAPN